MLVSLALEINTEIAGSDVEGDQHLESGYGKRNQGRAPSPSSCLGQPDSGLSVGLTVTLRVRTHYLLLQLKSIPQIVRGHLTGDSCGLIRKRSSLRVRGQTE